MWQYRAMCCNIYTKKESRLGLSCDPRGARTHDPNIKSVVTPRHLKASPTARLSNATT